MRGSSEGLNKILKIEPDIYEMSANLLCCMEECLEHEIIPKNWEHILDVCIDVLRDASTEYRKRQKIKGDLDNMSVFGGIFND